MHTEKKRAGKAIVETQRGIEIPDAIKKTPAWNRLEDQLAWYDKKSTNAQNWYKRLKRIQLLLAVLIPIISHIPDGYRWIIAVLGASIAILEAIQHIEQYSTLWVTYRSTAEFLKHEKFLFLSKAGPYRALSEEERILLLAERTEERVSTEHANWFNETKKINLETQKK